MSEPGTPQIPSNEPVVESVEQKTAEFRKFRLPDVFPGVDGNPERYAVLYDGESLLAEIKKQREGGKLASLTDSIKSTAMTSGRLIDRARLTEEEKRKVLEVCPDYLMTEDSADIMIFTSDNAKLAANLDQYFRDRLICLYNDKFYEDSEPNVDNTLKDRIFSHLGLVYDDKQDPTPEEIRSKQNSIDIGFEVYPGIASQVRFINAFDLLKRDMDRYPFINQADYKYAKKLGFNNPSKVKGFVSSGVSPDFAMQLDLLAFLKKSGHTPVLRMSQNALPYHDYPEKEHYSFAV